MTITEKPFNHNNCSLRDGNKIEAIVIHIAQGSIQALHNWAASINNKVSSWHYGVANNGDKFHYCPDEYMAWHAGLINKPSSALVIEKGSLNPNKYTIGIETEGYLTDVWPATKFDGLGELVKWLCEKYGIPKDRKHIIGHYEIDSVTRNTCPCRVDYRDTLWTELFKRILPPEIDWKKKYDELLIKYKELYKMYQSLKVKYTSSQADLKLQKELNEKLKEDVELLEKEIQSLTDALQLQKQANLELEVKVKNQAEQLKVMEEKLAKCKTSLEKCQQDKENLIEKIYNLIIKPIIEWIRKILKIS